MAQIKNQVKSKRLEFPAESMNLRNDDKERDCRDKTYIENTSNHNKVKTEQTKQTLEYRRASKQKHDRIADCSN